MCLQFFQLPFQTTGKQDLSRQKLEIYTNVTFEISYSF